MTGPQEARRLLAPLNEDESWVNMQEAKITGSRYTVVGQRRSGGIRDRKKESHSELSLWMRRALYQLGFVITLSVFVGVLLWCHMITMDAFTPRKWRQNGNPALGFRPTPQDPFSTLIHFRHGNSGNWKHFKDNLFDSLTKPHRIGYNFGASIECNWSSQLDEHNHCYVGKRAWVDLTVPYPCSKQENYGYSRGMPCVGLRVTRLVGWEPEPYYNMTEILQLEGMPHSLKKVIEKWWIKHCKGRGQSVEARCPQLRVIWVSCQGVTAADEENLGSLNYTPLQGFPGFFFPFLGQNSYESPVVFLQMRDLTPGVLVAVNCKLWARNIRHDKNNPRVGGVHFEILMD